MRKKRSKFLTFMFSLLPGAGHMLMGFMKTGLSLMSIFFFVIFLSSWLNIGPILFILPMIWFYSFFDSINRRYASDEEFELLDDKFLFSIDKLIETNNVLFQKRRIFAGVLLFLLGIFLVWRNALDSLQGFFPDEIFNLVNRITRYAPQMILGIAIVVIGVRLIVGKRKERDNYV